LVSLSFSLIAGVASAIGGGALYSRTLLCNKSCPHADIRQIIRFVI
jgi:hypothetical protein